MTSLATGSSATVTLRDDGKCTVTTNGGDASVVETVAGVSTTHAFGPRPMRMAFGPYSEGASLVITNTSAVLDYDSPQSDVRYARDSSGNVTGLVGPDGELLLLGTPPPDTDLLFDNFRWVAGDQLATEAITISGTFVSQPVDVARFRLQDSTLQVVVGGSGTIRVEVSGSADGVYFFALPNQLTGLTAGTSILKMRASTMQDWPFYRFTFRETGGASTATVKAFLMGQDVVEDELPATGFVQRFGLGDNSIGVSVAASTSIDSAPVDLRGVRRDSSSIVVTITGTGTAKLTVFGSRDGMENLHSLGDRITGMTAGTYLLSLNDSNLAFFPFYTLRVTETGGANAVVATVAITARVAAARANKPTVLLLADSSWVQSTDWTNNWDAPYRTSVALLEKMGYAVDLRAVDDVPSTFLDSVGRPYEFIYFPHLRGNNWSTWTSGAGYVIGRILKGQCPVPVLACGMDQSANATLLAAVGANTKDTTAYRKILWRGAPWYMQAGAFSVTTQAHMTSVSTLATDFAGTSAIAWRFKGANGWVYVASGSAYQGETALPFLIADALQAGHISTPPKKLRAVIDIDDMPDCGGGGGNGTQTIGDCERVYAAMRALSMPCSWGLRPEDFTASRVPAAVQAFVAANTANKGGLLYPIAHSGNWMWKDGTKATKAAAYAADVANLTSRGIKIGDATDYDAWGYYYFNNNAFDEATLQLGTPSTAFSASPDDLTAQAGYGWRVVRSDAINGTNTIPIGANKEGSFGKCWHRGILVVGGFNHMSSSNKSFDFDDAGAGSALIALQCERLFNRAIAWNTAYYIHGSNCYDGHDSGDAPGTRWLELIVGVYGAGLSEVMEFVHGSALAE